MKTNEKYIESNTGVTQYIIKIAPKLNLHNLGQKGSGSIGAIFFLFPSVTRQYLYVYISVP